MGDHNQALCILTTGFVLVAVVWCLVLARGSSSYSSSQRPWSEAAICVGLGCAWASAVWAVMR